MQDLKRNEQNLERLRDKVTDIEELTGCRKNCQYRQYEIVQTINPVPNSDKEIFLKVTLASDIVNVYNETLIVSMRSLIAEIGGTLGLFLGFSFLMLWDFFEYIVVIALNKLK